MTKQNSLEIAVLTEKEAGIRAKQIEAVDYHLSFRLPESEPNYSGKIEATLEIANQAAQLSPQIFMDFAGGGTVQEVTLNGKVISFEYNGSKIYIPSREFKTGKNLLTIRFTHPYGSSGFGFHRSQDKADGQYYMYSDFEPYNANKAFPVFDQPDLKASYTLVVDAPSHWEVIANALESRVQSLDGTWKRWEFPKTHRFSSYLFALIAGPFQKWEAQVKSRVPMRLFARASMAEYLKKDVDHWFQVTHEGFKYFEEAFGYPYPFGKYDQILTPDYNHGAMENIGAVTFTEKYVFRSEATPIQVLRRAETIIHELAHMWFGNLVTMKWWDDLWLNESFATYVSNLAMSKFNDKICAADVWQQFHATNKEWAYREDDYVTTHPIVGKAEDTAEALANFDGITYGKGAAVLKQLVYYIGEKAFTAGLKNYFQEFAFKNATRTDFIQALSKSSGKDLISWETAWLKSSGTNAVQVLVTEKAGKIEKLVLKQSPDPADKKLRPHRTEVGFYDLNSKGEIGLRETLSVTYTDAETVVSEASGKVRPQFIFPNVADHDFVQVVLDDQSLTALETSLGKIQDAFLRQMLWSAIWNMVRHAQLPAQNFAQIAAANLKNEKDLAVLQKSLEYLLGTFWYITPELKTTGQRNAEAFVSSLFQNAAAKSPTQILLFSRYVSVAKSADASQLLKKWLHQEEAAPGLKMDQERRWEAITRLSANGVSDVHPMIEQERKQDKNDKGILSAMIAEICFPDKTNKLRWWNRLLERDSTYEKLSIEKARSLMAAFHDPDHPELTEFMRDEFFELIPQIIGKFPDEFNSSFAALMYPNLCNESVLQKTTDLLNKYPNLQVGVRRELLKNRQLHQRTIQARNLSHSKMDRKMSGTLEKTPTV